MTNYSIFKTSMLFLFSALLLNSCSTGYQASRYSHLKYVKKDHDAGKANESQALNNTDMKSLEKHSPAEITIPNNDYASAAKKIATQKPDHKHDISKKTEEQLPVPDEALAMQKHSFGNTIGQAGTAVKNKFEDLKSLTSHTSIADDQHKLLLLWLILLGASIVLWLFYGLSSAFAVLATIALIASIVFFVLWLVNIAES
ncbi:MAG: hypothetical protein WBB36_00685 [Chitinophagales bacterium]